MKKLLIILMLAFMGFGVSAQQVIVNNDVIETFPTYTITTVDTSWVFHIKHHSTATIQARWISLAGTLDCTFRLQGTIDKGVSWFDLNMASYTPTAVTGFKAFHITAGTGTDWGRYRILFDRNSVSGGAIIISATINYVKP